MWQSAMFLKNKFLMVALAVSEAVAVAKAGLIFFRDPALAFVIDYIDKKDEQYYKN